MSHLFFQHTNCGGHKWVGGAQEVYQQDATAKSEVRNSQNKQEASTAQQRWSMQRKPIASWTLQTRGCERIAEKYSYTLGGGGKKGFWEGWKGP